MLQPLLKVNLLELLVFLYMFIYLVLCLFKLPILPSSCGKTPNLLKSQGIGRVPSSCPNGDSLLRCN